VTPLEALSSSVEPSHDDVRSGTARKVWSIVLMAGGAVLMLLGLAVSSLSPVAVLPAALGGFVSFAGVAVGATVVMPPVLQLIGRIGSHDPVVLLAGRNAMRAPGRSSRATIGLVIGVTLLVTFAVALGIMQHVLETEMRAMSAGSATPEMIEAQRDLFVQINAVVSVIVGFSAVIAAVGVVNALALGVLQRRRELGLLRVLGLTGAQVRRMIVTEAVQMVVAAVVSGLALGTLYGWVGGQTLLGSLGTPVAPVLPPLTIGIVVIGALVLAVVATISPVRRARRGPPTEARGVDCPVALVAPRDDTGGPVPAGTGPPVRREVASTCPGRPRHAAHVRRGVTNRRPDVARATDRDHSVTGPRHVSTTRHPVRKPRASRVTRLRQPAAPVLPWVSMYSALLLLRCRDEA
ncbi:ABC transporter permease, partial [Curtobacterium flaccumfaciens]|nr:ABC transporter permease [Curtobacterium flaccumfaciens]